MAIDAERLRALLSNAQQSALLCAPFIKARTLSVLLAAIPKTVSIHVITRWKAEEVAAGVSDLEVFEIVNDRSRTTLSLLDNLHAKLYLADEHGFVGSANLTASALGWAERSNIEILVPVTRQTTEVRRLLAQLEAAIPATFALRSEVASQAGKLVTVTLAEGSKIRGDEALREVAWLPSCATPERLYGIYANSEYPAVVEDTRTDALADLHELQVPDGMKRELFVQTIRDALRLMPAFRGFLDRAPGGITDHAGISAVAGLRPSLSQGQTSDQWHIVREWIKAFFGEEFEVAPQSFVVRLRRPSG